MKKIIYLLLICGSSLTIMAQKITEKNFVPTEDIVVFPITLINAFPFISGEVNGVKGKFMFDTGNQNALDINDNLVQLTQKKEKGSGQVGSGQKFKANINDTIAEVKLADGSVYKNLVNIKSGNYDFLQNAITPDCIGYIGHNFFKGYLVKLDYLRRKIILYKNTDQRKSSKDFLEGEKVLAIINFEIRRLPNHPLVRVKIGGIEMIAAFDTGQYGTFQLEDKVDKLLTAKSLIIPSGKDAENDKTYTINDMVLDGKFKVSLKGVYSETREDNEHVREALQITEDNIIDIGYRFLDQYKTIWDYEAKKIYILEK
ncbi:hypothetical protein L0669_19635 [Flavobacterium bizetiae]|uniref:hypothetical protein n=1 Tax=Flavobacterium bizetiae TaxID=2704140 RepID=UPI0021E849E4|nr:hypothetical protein [Flavobacterium bizetiae]UTN03535.1 hypothetical protein L0669_19635 [Flavobacterium bizetiae]